MAAASVHLRAIEVSKFHVIDRSISYRNDITQFWMGLKNCRWEQLSRRQLTFKEGLGGLDISVTNIVGPN